MAWKYCTVLFLSLVLLTSGYPQNRNDISLPLLDSMNAVLSATIDMTKLNTALKDYIDKVVQDQVMASLNDSISLMLERMEDLKTEIKMPPKECGKCHQHSEGKECQIRKSRCQEALVGVDEIKSDLKNSTFFSVMLDESTDRSTEKTLMIYVRYLKNGQSVTRFLSVTELSSGTADSIFECVKSVFKLYNLPFQKCMSNATDGANVMTGIRSGVSTRFTEVNPYIIKSHCIAHRLALAASQAAHSVPHLKKYQGTLNEIYKYYHYSCKHMAELKSMAVIFDKAEKKFQEVFGTRWLSFEGSDGALLSNFDILVGCLLSDEQGGNIIACDLVKFISTFEFLAVSHFMADVMCLVCRVSRVFQKEDLTFTVVKEALDHGCSAISDRS